MTTGDDSPHQTNALHRQGKAVNRRIRRSSGVAAPSHRPPRASALDRIRYWFDGALSRGPSVVIGWLGLLTLAIIVIAAAVMAIFGLSGINGGEELGFAEAFWQAMLRIVDAGTFAADSGWVTRILGLLITLSGIFLAGSLIGLIASAVDQRIELLRKGRSVVLEQDHTLILGWSERVPAIVRELVIANESRKRAAVVVLAGEDKTTMEDTLRGAIDDFRTTRLVCRSGDTSTPTDLELVNVKGARSIVIAGGSDPVVVKTLLAVRAVDPDGEGGHVVAELTNPEVGTSVRSVFGPRVVIVNSDSIVAELTAQACRQRGLSQVFHELLDFDGDEIYFASFAELAGTTYADAQLAFEHSCLMGRLVDGVVELNPAPNTVIGPSDELIGISSDDDTFVFTGARGAVRGLEPEPARPEGVERRMIIVGWSELGPRVIRELDEFLGAETTLEIVVDPNQVDLEDVRSSIEVANVAVEISTQSGGPEQIAAHAARRAFHEVIVLGQRGDVAPEEADARTLLTLLAFNQVVRQHQLGKVRIVAELLEQRHAALAEATGADDFIVSDELTSLMIAQLAERRELDQLFADLFDREGCTIEIVDADTYGATAALNFAEVVAAASALGHTALGYRSAGSGTVVLNPPKSAVLELGADDGVVILR
jgi:ion channel POLLUX/CASTOR